MQNYSAEEFKKLPEEERVRRLAALTPRERKKLLYDWSFWARMNQRLPPGEWSTWLILAGRGYGKTRTGGETMRGWSKNFKYINLAGATTDDARDIMVEGESGILAICPKHERPLYKKSERKLLWPSGAISLIFTADEPDRARGKQSEKLWCDEVAAWRYRDTWDQLMLGLRLGRSPQCIATTTPRPTELIREIAKDEGTLMTHGTTYENRSNLAPSFFTRIIKRFEGTRLGRQELNAEILDDNPNAIFMQEHIDRDRIHPLMMPADTQRIVVAVDPAVTSNENSDETGIIVCARDCRPEPHYYVLADKSLTMATPRQWADATADAYRTHMADRVVGEINNGGDMVEAVIRNVDDAISYSSVRASRGKVIRAEPIGALYEQGRVHHVGTFEELEKQMRTFNPLADEKSPDRMDALVWALTELSEEEFAPEPVTRMSRRRML